MLFLLLASDVGCWGYGIATFDIPTPQGVASPSFRLLNCTRFCMHLQGPPALQLPSQNGQTILTHSWLTLTVYEALRGSTTTPPSSSSRLYTLREQSENHHPTTIAHTCLHTFSKHIHQTTHMCILPMKPHPLPRYAHETTPTQQLCPQTMPTPKLIHHTHTSPTKP